MNAATPNCLSVIHSMLGFIALPSALVLAVALLVILRKRRGADSGRHFIDLSPVSGEWLSDYRRSR
jgi:hypothetical protein